MHVFQCVRGFARWGETQLRGGGDPRVPPLLYQTLQTILSSTKASSSCQQGVMGITEVLKLLLCACSDGHSNMASANKINKLHAK